jgi:mannose-6-phosphate isomerase
VPHVPPLYPLKFDPIFKTALWGGRRLATLFPSAPADGPLAEAWVLSDQGDNVSRVSNGPLAGTTLRDLMHGRRGDLLGPAAHGHDEFPLLLKFIDARDQLSVQVHPDDDGARRLAGHPRGKTEAWVVTRADAGSRIYAGLRGAVGREQFETALRDGTTEELLHSFEPKVGDCVFLPAGIVHAIGGGLMVFEVQQTSDVTFRLHDWGRVDAKTGRPRELHIEQALACTDFGSGPRRPVWPSLEHAGPVERERLVQCEYFRLYRYRGSRPFVHDGGGAASVLVGLDGEMTVRGGGREDSLRPGDVMLLPATLGRVECVPAGQYLMLECVPV